MDELSIVVVRYDAADRIFWLSLAGRIDEQGLNQRVGLLRSSLEAHLEQDHAIRLLIDIRKTEWDSDQTRVSLRQALGNHLQEFREHRYLVAILANEQAWQTSEHEAHFTDEREAWTWLRGAE